MASVAPTLELVQRAGERPKSPRPSEITNGMRDSLMAIIRGQMNRATNIHIGILTGFMIILSIELVFFARIQDIWVDESTQLSGIKLDLGEMLRWLGGRDPDRFGVPGDRMPPLSYLLDWSWLRLCGPSTLGFRLFHSAFVVAGATILVAAAWREIGAWGAMAAGALLVLSPRLFETGVEIRAYPIFFAITCAQLAVFLRLVEKPKEIRTWQLSLFVIFSVAACYTHFYGLVSTCAFIFALGIAFIRSRASIMALVVVVVVLAVSWSGLWPFIFSSVKMSEQATADVHSSAKYINYMFRLLGTSANAVSVAASVLFFAGAITLLLVGAVTALARARNRTPISVDWLFLVVIAGVSAPLMASLVVRSFNALTPSYSGWLFAPLALLIAAGATSLTGFRAWDQVGRFAAFAAVLIGSALATGEFLAHASEFTHGPQRFVGAAYDGTASPRAIVYETGADWGFSYFPLLFTHDGRIVQYRAAEDGVDLVRIGGDQTTARDLRQEVAGFQNILLVNTKLRTFRDLRECQNKSSSCPNFDQGRIESTLLAGGRWREAKVLRNFGIYDTEIKIMERVDTNP